MLSALMGVNSSSGHHTCAWRMQVVKSSGIVPSKYWQALEAQLLGWLLAVGASWRALIYQL